MILGNIRDEPHKITQFELVLNDEEIQKGLEFMDQPRRTYSKMLMQSDKCSRRLSGYLEVCLALEEMEALKLASCAGGANLDQAH